MRRRRSAILALCIVATAGSADAAPLTCQRAIAKASPAYFQAVSKATTKCNDAIITSGGGTCPDAKMTAALAKASSKLTAAITKACGGSDGTCDADPVDEDLPSAIGWPNACPNVATAHCDGAIESCADIASCLTCLGTEVASATHGLAFEALALPSTGDAPLNRCQRALGRANDVYGTAVSRALAKCWQARLLGRHTNSCEPPALGDGKHLAAIAKADAKRTAKIGQACGGADHALGGSNDLSPATIGFADACPHTTVPGGPACAGPITDLTSAVACLDCVSDAALACTDRAAVPQLAAYPPECVQCLEPPMTGTCPTTIALVTEIDRVDFDIGFSGIGHDETLPSNSGFTLALSGCDGTQHPTCGECDLAGPISGAGGPSDANRRCAGDPGIACTADNDCDVCTGGSNVGAACSSASECPGATCDGAPCVFFLGPPQDLSIGFTFCVLNEIAAPVSGTINLTDGSAAASLALRARLHGNQCPICDAGVCAGGTNHGEPCTAQADGPNGPVSLDCPPSNLVFGSVAPMVFPLSTDVQSQSITSGSPACRETGFGTLQCMCDTCNNGDLAACMSNADCPASGGAPGICGGRRCIGGGESGKPCNVCLGGGNHGATCSNASACPGGTCSVGCGGVCSGGPNSGASCSTSSQCPGSTCSLGACNRPGEATRPNSCYDDTTTPGAPPLCAPTGNGEGACAVGPIDSICSVDTDYYCDTDDDCVPIADGGSCNGCTTADQTCRIRPRECFTDNGTPGNPVLAVGAPSPPCGGIARPTLAGLACMPPSAATFFNSGFGLPGLTRLRMPVELTP